MTAARPRRPSGLRREVAILLPTCLVLLVALSTYTLFSYRAALDRLVEERRSEALRTARSLAADAAALPAPPDAMALARLRAGAAGVERLALLDASGELVAAAGELDTPPLAPWPEGAAAADPFAAAGAGVAAGPDDEPQAAVSAYVPFVVAGARHLLRVDLPAGGLAARRREVRVLTPVVVGVDVAVGLLVLFFLRHLMAPYEALLAQARRIGGDQAGGEDEDEVAFLVRTFESGLAALARTRAGGAEEDIAALERMLGGSLESGLLLLDHEGRVVALNPVGERLLEVPAPAAGTPLEEALAARPELASLLAGALAEGAPVQRREIELAGADGGRHVLGLSVHPLRGAAAARGFLVLFADLTEVRRQADEARLADGLVRLGELAAGVAHELRNGLATLRGYLALAERSPAEAASFLAEMRREADHLQRVLEDFLSFARPGSVRLEEVRAGALLARAAADPALAGARVRVDDGGLGDTVLRGDPQLLERALRNLLQNAVQAQGGAAEGGVDDGASDGGEPVEARLRRAPEGLEIVVEDRGPGVPAELAERIFDPFVTARPGGVGLGLALTHRIVDLHGGAVRLEGREGGGTRAVVRLPA